MKAIIDTLKLRSKNRLEKVEGFSILFIFIGAVTLSLGIGLSILNPKGISAIITMLGSVIAFLATLVLIIIWFAKEWSSE